MLFLSFCEAIAATDAERIPITTFSSSALENGVPPGWNLELRHGTPNLRIERMDLTGTSSPKTRRAFRWGEAQASVQAGQYCLHLSSDGESSFGISRNMFRQMALEGKIPGVTKGSW